MIGKDKNILSNDYKYHYIYRNTCKVTGKFYIGLHSTDDLNDGYYGSGKILIKSIKKYGISNHVMEILEFLPSRDELSIRESEIVNADLLADPMCMNIKLGGFAGSHIAETRERISISLSKSYDEIYGDLDADLQREKRKNGALNQWKFYTEDKKNEILGKLNSGLIRHYEKSPYVATSYVCPHCLTEGRGPAMFKHHFDNCYKITGIVKTISQETKDKIRKKLTGTKLSEETLLKLRGRIPENKGKVYDRIVCPHCEKSVAVNVANRDHFDKCKFRDKHEDQK